MKVLITALFLIIVFVSCQKEYTGEFSNETPAGNTSGSFTAKVNSNPFVADKGAGATFTNAGNGLPRLINIAGLSNDKRYISITLVDSGVHKYTLADNFPQAGAYIDSTLPNTYAFTTLELNEEIAGTVDITSINTATKTMSGTFSFTAYKEMDSTEVSITEGVFTNIPYIDGAIMPPSASSDTFHVKVNNNLFTAYSISGFDVTVNHTIRLQGADSLGVELVALSIPDTIPVGTYDMASLDYYGLYMDGTSSFGSVSGTLKILEHNTTTKRIRGTFDFKAEESTDTSATTQLTEGYFSIQYQ